MFNKADTELQGHNSFEDFFFFPWQLLSLLPWFLTSPGWVDGI